MLDSVILLGSLCCFLVCYAVILCHAEENRLHKVALKAIKVANDPHLLPYTF